MLDFVIDFSIGVWGFDSLKTRLLLLNEPRYILMSAEYGLNYLSSIYTGNIIATYRPDQPVGKEKVDFYYKYFTQLEIEIRKICEIQQRVDI